MSDSAPVVLTLLAGFEVSQSAERVIAASGARIVRARTPSASVWRSAAAVIVDADSAHRCVRAGLSRRQAVFLVGACEPSPAAWAAAVDVGAQRLFALPQQESELLGLLSEAVEAAVAPARRGRVIAVTAGRGGGGASVFATALAQLAGDALIVDLDPGGGGIDLVAGVESVAGLRWPDLNLGSGRLGWDAVRAVLPRRLGVSVLSSSRSVVEIAPEPAAAIIEAGRRGGVTVVCDVPRHLSAAGLYAVEAADLVVVITPCDVRGIAAATASVGIVRTVNPSVGLVVRGPSPGGLRPREAGAAVSAPVLAAMRPEPMLDRRLETGGLRLGRRSPLADAARRVLALEPPTGAHAA